MTRLQVNGISLNVESAGAGRPLVLLHGFTGSTKSWGPHLPALTQEWRLIAVDVIGHGRSDAPVDWQRYRMEHCVEDLLALLDALGIDRFDLLGYSMGARVALHLAAAAEERIGALILESGTPGLADAAERQARIAADEALAGGIDREGLVTFIDRWEQVPLFASQANLPAEVRAHLRAQRLESDPVGLAHSLRGMGTGRQEPLWDRLPSLQVPALLLAGTLDTKFCGLAEQMAALLPLATVQIVPNSGHTIHLEQPAAFQQAVLGFLSAQLSSYDKLRTGG
jgi:2-succinyl-6-hydroxy-2,4-cyclohexadiene-1-carboxylate synthase